MSANISLLMLRNLIGLAVWGAVFALSAHAAKKTPAQPAQATPAPEAETEAPTEQPAKTPGKVTGTYSTLKSLGGEDDMIGIEVIIVKSREGFRAFVQTADGVPAAPVLVPVDVDGAAVTFTVPSTTGEPLQFKGKATRQGLNGTLDERPVTLPRRRSYWQ